MHLIGSKMKRMTSVGEEIENEQAKKTFNVDYQKKSLRNTQ